MDVLDKEMYDAVNRINDEISYLYEDEQHDIMPMLSVEFTGIYQGITLFLQFREYGIDCKIKIYNSENNDRIYYEETDTEETMYDYIKRKINSIKKEIVNIKGI